ncbi:hypothetical protein Bca4012_042494 [Brassica carinata]|uniref:Disease resistance R13L4/SHOC-2-like LRR domain-containing protein n=1 Tax=Brassica carinata TaxID=52824 RepID=A0A8X7QYQ7_BRACI|nr:hypothetical protein Bca52824_059780 [Brassica carinata]
MSLMVNTIEEMTCSSKCSELTTLLLQDNHYLKNLSGEVIQHMQKLVVLDLSSNLNISGLPDRISELNSLQYLDLSDTRVEQLPVGFQELIKLTHLNLASTYRLCSISGISKLSSLRSLKLFGSNVRGDVNLVKELQLLEHLQVLTIDVSSELGLQQILGDQRLMNCIYRLHIHDFQEKPFNLSLLVSMENLRELRISLQFRYELNISAQCLEKVVILLCKYPSRLLLSVLVMLRSLERADSLKLEQRKATMSFSKVTFHFIFFYRHVSVSLKLVAVFGTIVQSTVSARGSVCVDLHVEERSSESKLQSLESESNETDTL